MLKEMVNNVVVEGLLSEINLKKLEYTKDGEKKKGINGNIKIKAVIPFDGEDKTLEVPVYFFVSELTNKGNTNPAYVNLETVIDTGNSIAAVGEDNASAVRVIGTVRMNEYFTPDGRFINMPRVNASFVNFIKKEEMNMKAQFDAEVYITKMVMDTNKDGIETGVLRIYGANVGYNDYTDVIPIITNNPKYVDAIKATYREGDVIKLSAKLDFSNKVIKTYEEVAIGEPIEHTRTVSTNDLYITGIGISNNAASYSPDDIKACLTAREKRINDRKEKANKKPTSNGTKVSAANLGF